MSSPIHPEYYPLPKKTRDIEGAKKLMAEAGQTEFEHELITVEDDWEKSTGRCGRGTVARGRLQGKADSLTRLDLLERLV